MYSSYELKNIFSIKTLYTSFEAIHETNFDFDGERHDFWEILIVTDGEVTVTAGSDVFLLKKGQAVLHEPMEFHRLVSSGNIPFSIIVFSFEAVNMPSYSSKIFELPDIKEAARVLKNIRESYETQGICVVNVNKGENINHQLALKNLETFILKTLLTQKDVIKPAKSRTAANYKNIINVMEEHLHENLSVADIARLCSMSEINLKKTFSMYAGMGVMNYFNSMKINEAINLLKAGMSVKETALSLGFLNQNYFSTVFKRITGHSPSDYKWSNH